MRHDESAMYPNNNGDGMNVNIDRNELRTPLVNDLSIGSTVRNVINELPVFAVADTKAPIIINIIYGFKFGQV